MASAVAVPAAVCLTLTLYLFCIQRSKKRALEDYTSIILRDPLATLPGNPDKKLLDCLNDEWEAVSWAALTKPQATVQETVMGDCFENLQKCKLAHELEMFRRFLRKDMTEAQRQKVAELEVEMRKKFDDEMKILSAPVYSSRMRYNTMIDFFIIAGNDMMKAAIGAGLSDYKLPEHELKISHLSMSGGGARGYAYGKMLENLKDSLTPHCRFSGTSAGAIGALAAALGLDNFDGLVLEMQRRYGNSARANRQWTGAYEWIRKQYAGWPGYYDLIGVLALFDERVQDKICAFLENISDDTIDVVFANDPEARERMRLLKKPYDTTESRRGKMLTFEDLSDLQKLPGGEQQFHDFAAAIWDKTDQKLIFAKKETYPDMPVVLAMYASMSIPLFFKFPSIPLDKSGGKPHQLCDGGYGAHLPIDAYSVDRKETCGVVFDCDGWGGKTLCGNVKSLPRFVRWCARKLRIALNIEANIKHEKKRVLQSLDQILVLPHGDLRVFDFTISPQTKIAIDHQADLRVKAWKICKICGYPWPQSPWATLTSP
jgi:predicted acylesterase/phospholipase RssA